MVIGTATEPPGGKLAEAAVLIALLKALKLAGVGIESEPSAPTMSKLWIT